MENNIKPLAIDTKFSSKHLEIFLYRFKSFWKFSKLSSNFRNSLKPCKSYKI